MDFLSNLAVGFSSIFQEGGKTFVGLVTGIIPSLIVLMTAVNAIVALIGPEKVEGLAKKAGSPGLIWYPVRYIIFPFVAAFILTNPMAYIMGRFLPEKFKPAWLEVSFRIMHYSMGIFPHINPGEIFTWMGIASGIQKLNLSLADLAVRYLLAGMTVMLISGILTEKIYGFLEAREARQAKTAEAA